ncbi:slit homolog 3 protein-like [Gigantopelta aegis]|uniref:slit homolog 3 protein-like n=1 Tax=Gigantopelta aegis TaxID=1735272 RepID=UPI001B887933|nr:slit homolog 3 protein-like [Gigantopelta aegis]
MTSSASGTDSDCQAELSCESSPFEVEDCNDDDWLLHLSSSSSPSSSSSSSDHCITVAFSLGRGMTPLKLLFLGAVFQATDRFFVSSHLRDGTKTFQIKWQNGSVELFNYEKSESSDCIYDNNKDILSCTRSHPYDVITSIWRNNPELIQYVNVNCLLRKENVSRSKACVCKNTTMVGNSTKDRDNEKYYSCQLEQLPFNIFSTLINVEVIDLSYNRIQSIDVRSFLNCASLEYLALNHNPLSSYPQGMLCGLSRLKFVDVSHQLLTRFPSNIFKCETDSQSSVLAFKISHCLIEEIVDDTFRYLHELISLDLTANRIKRITENGFVGASSLLYIDLSNNSLSQIPLFICSHVPKLTHLLLQKNQFQFINMTNVQNCHSLEAMDLSENIFNSLEGPKHPMTSLKNLKLGHNIFIAIRDSMTLKHFPAISELDFSWNQIVTIENASFDGIKSMHRLDLSNNNLTDSSADFRRVFQNLQSLTYLNLSSNGLTTGLDLAFEELSSLMELDLSYNRLKVITNNSVPGLKKLRHLKINNNKLQSIHRYSFMDMSNLESIDMSHNKLVSLEMVHFPGILMLDASWNSLEDIPSRLPVTISRLQLMGNRISSLRRADVKSLVRLKELNISHNVITFLDDDSFLSSYNMTSVDLSFNDLKLDFGKDVFRGMQHIRNIYLTHNNIHSIDGILQFDSLTTLQNLDVSFNNIEEIGEPLNPSNKSKHLQTLNLEGCQITTIVKIAFINLSHLKSVNLQKNMIVTVPLFDAPIGAEFRLVDNRLRCSCNMSWLIDRLSNRSSLDYDVDVCAVFPHGWIYPIRSLSPDQFLCPVGSCPEQCSCYSTKGNGTVAITVCHRGVLTIPVDIHNDSTTIYLDGNNFAELGTIVAPFVTDMSVKKLLMNNSHVLGIGSSFFDKTLYLEEVDLSHNYIKVLPSDIFHRLMHIKFVHLQQNQISYLPSSLFKGLNSLEMFDISANRLTYLLSETLHELDNMEHFRWINLASNPWRCKCSTKALRIWLEESSSPVFDRRQVFCNNKEMLQVQLDEFYCPPVLSESVKIGLICVSLTIFVLGVGISIAYYRQTLIPLLYRRLGLRCLKRNQISSSAVTLYDLLVLVDDKDHKCVWWVKNSLVPKLTKNRWKFRIHVPEPNTEAGEITNSVMLKINQSKSTLIVVSKHFQENYWCVECSQHAYNLVLCKHHVVVLVVWGNINACTLDSEIREQIEKGDNLFIKDNFLWDKLIYKLPCPNDRENSSFLCKYKKEIQGANNVGFVVDNENES